MDDETTPCDPECLTCQMEADGLPHDCEDLAECPLSHYGERVWPVLDYFGNLVRFERSQVADL